MQLNNLGACDKLETDYHLLTYCVIFMLLDGPRNILVEGRRTNILMYDLIEYLFSLFLLWFLIVPSTILLILFNVCILKHMAFVLKTKGRFYIHNIM